MKLYDLAGMPVAEWTTEDGGAIDSSGAFLEALVNAGYAGAEALIVHGSHLPASFFDLRSGMAGEMLQKCSNYRFKLAVIGDFESRPDQHLRDFIRESNRRGSVVFAPSIAEASGLWRR